MLRGIARASAGRSQLPSPSMAAKQPEIVVIDDSRASMILYERGLDALEVSEVEIFG